MSQLLKVIINDEIVLEYNKSNRLPGHQRQFLDQMDADMSQGIKWNDEVLKQPDQEQRAKYVAMYLTNALLNKKDNMVTASCAYLSERLPELETIMAKENNGQITIDFNYASA